MSTKEVRDLHLDGLSKSELIEYCIVHGSVSTYTDS